MLRIREVKFLKSPYLLLSALFLDFRGDIPAETPDTEVAVNDGSWRSANTLLLLLLPLASSFLLSLSLAPWLFSLEITSADLFEASVFEVAFGGERCPGLTGDAVPCRR